MEVGNMTSAMVNTTGIASPTPIVKASEGKTPQENKPVNPIEKMRQEPGYIPSYHEQNVIRAIEEANRKLAGGPREFEFSVHEKTKQIMVKVVDTTTKEVVREIPSEKALDMVAGFMEAAGLLVDEKR